MAKTTLNKRGSMLMMVMVMLIVAAIIAMKLMPDEQTLVKRENESFYNSDLSQLREAIDLVRIAAKDPNSVAYFNENDPESTPDGWIDFTASDTPDVIQQKITKLTEWGFLRKTDLKDNSIPEFAWGTDASKNYWLVSTNYAQNASFEIASGDSLPAGWDADPATSNATAECNIRLNSMAIDEYPYQNKLGDNTRGPNAIKMIKITK